MGLGKLPVAAVALGAVAMAGCVDDNGTPDCGPEVEAAISAMNEGAFCAIESNPDCRCEAIDEAEGFGEGFVCEIDTGFVSGRGFDEVIVTKDDVEFRGDGRSGWTRLEERPDGNVGVLGEGVCKPDEEFAPGVVVNFVHEALERAAQ